MTSKGNLLLQYIVPLINYGGMRVDNDGYVIVNEETEDVLVDSNTKQPVVLIFNDTGWIKHKFIDKSDNYIFDPFQNNKSAAYLGSLIRDVLNEEFNDFDDEEMFEKMMNGTFLAEDSQPIQLIERHTTKDGDFIYEFIDVKSANKDLDKDGTDEQYWISRTEHFHEKCYGKGQHRLKNLALIGACISAIQRRTIGSGNNFIANYTNDYLDVFEEILEENERENKNIKKKYKGASKFGDDDDDIKDIEARLTAATYHQFDMVNENEDFDEFDCDIPSHYAHLGGNRINQRTSKVYTKDNYKYIEEDEVNLTDYGSYRGKDSDMTDKEYEELLNSQVLNERDSTVNEDADLGLDFDISEFE